MLTTLHTAAAFDGTLDDSLAMINGTNVRAHQQAAGPKGFTEFDLGRSPGGGGSKLHLITARMGKPMVCAPTAGQRHESPQAIPLLERALLRMWPEEVARDKGYSSREIRIWLEEQQIEAVIPKRTDETNPTTYYQALCHERSRTESAVNQLKRLRLRREGLRQVGRCPP